VCVGKSTYARCFSGDTRVALANGTSATLEDMVRRSEHGETFFGYSIDAEGRLILAKLEAPRYIGRDSLLEIRLDDGALIRATPDHLFMTRDGRMVPAGDLRASDSLMPLYRHLRGGYEMVYQPLGGRLCPTHRLSDEWNLRHGIYGEVPATRRRHIDGDRLNNDPTNIVRMGAAGQSRRAADSTWAGAQQPGRDRPASRRIADLVAHGARRWVRDANRPQDGVRNHKVAAVREIAGDHDVYCLTVPEAGNFALAAGVFVHNCGIIVNVTPLEPEWEGHVTLEFSNTTPLPAKIYANEGVAQMLFFESDEVCDTSYKDRDGKYQGQRGVTLPKT
jgi:dCTP deaminase